MGYDREIATSSSGFPHLIWKYIYIYITWYNSHHSQGLCWWLGSWGRMEKQKIETSTILKTKARTVVGDHTSWHKLGPATSNFWASFKSKEPNSRPWSRSCKAVPWERMFGTSNLEVPEMEGLVSWCSNFGSKNLVCQNLWLLHTSCFCNKTFKSFGGRNFAPRYGQSNATMDTAIIKNVNGNLPIL